MGKEKTNSAEKETRQSNKEILRLFQLDALFQEDRYYSIEELKNRLHVSVATLNRDFSKLRDSYRAPLEFDRDHNGYHYTSRLYKFPAVFVNEDEMPIYSIVMKLFDMFQGTPLYAPLLNICENFESPVKSEMIDENQVKFKNSHIKEKEWFETRIVIAKRGVDSIDEGDWNIILTALKENRVLQFDYDSVTENVETFARTLEPWQLIFDRGQWYIKGMASKWDNPAEKVARTFVLPRMKNLKLLGKYFSLPSENEWMHEKYTPSYFGATTTGTKELCQFIFQGSALYFSGADFAPDKKVEPYTGEHRHKDGAVLVSFTSNQQPALIREFFSYGEDIIPLAPEHLVQEWKDRAKGLMEYL